MAQAQQKQPKAPTKKQIKDVAARVSRGENSIQKILETERLVMSAKHIRVFFKEGDKTTGGSIIPTRDFGKLIGRPDLLILPQVTIEPKNE